MSPAIITINDRKTDTAFNQNATISDVIQSILSEKENSDQIVSEISIDGHTLNFEEEDTVMLNRIGQFTKVNFVLKSNIELAFEALDSSNAYIDRIIGQIQALTKSYQDCQTQEANALFAEVIEITDLFIQLISRVQHTLRGHMTSQWSKPASVTQLEIHLLSILKALVPAKEKNDIIMLCDLLEYELVDNLKQWKIKALPELRALRPVCDSIAPHN